MKDKISFLNGEFVAHKDAYIHIDDRSTQFADGIYEVILFRNGVLSNLDGHLNRLYSSLEKLHIIDFKHSKEEITNIILETFAKNDIVNGFIYIQISRGVHARNQTLPTDIVPTFIMVANEHKIQSEDNFMSGIKVMTHDDIRWKYCDIKSTNLLAGTLVRTKASDNGCDDAIFIRDGIITECTFANLFIVKNNELITHPLNQNILPGITRDRVIKLAKSIGILVKTQEFGIDELLSADEVFATSTTLIIRAIVQIDDIVISAKAGKITSKLNDMYLEFLGAR